MYWVGEEKIRFFKFDKIQGVFNPPVIGDGSFSQLSKICHLASNVRKAIKSAKYFIKKSILCLPRLHLF